MRTELPVIGMRYTRSGRAMVLTYCSPRSSKAMSRWSRICSCATALRQIPPGSASASSLAAMLTAIAEDVAVLYDEVTVVDAHTDSQRRGSAALRGIISCCTLDRTAHRVDDAGELDKQTIAGGLGPRVTARGSDPVLGDFGIAQPAPNRAQRRPLPSGP
jgi:hypothetical protein